MLSFLYRKNQLPQKKQRRYWLETMQKIADPVLGNLSRATLKRNLPVLNSKCQPYAPLEAFSRLSCGITPWFELDDIDEHEKELNKKYQELFFRALDNATDPESPDYMIFDGNTSRQPLVDAAFLCHALLRAPNNIVKPMDARVKENLVRALEITRKIEPWNNNWVLFSAMVETGLGLLGADFDFERIDKYIRLILSWYKGDGIYGDGADFRYDYYNSFVIQPMLVDIVKFHRDRYADVEEIILKRAQRYASIQEKLISPEGYYPITGRSICYRFGAFQLLAQASLQKFLDNSIRPAQVRCALTEVIKKSIISGGTFDKSGWLQPGVYGCQPDLAEYYINTGSLYLCSTIFLPLGLPSSDGFWADPNCKWTSQKIISGDNFKADEHLKEKC